MTKESKKALDELVGKVSRVRSWLVWLAVLKGAAAGLVFVIAYIGLYAVIDHYAHVPPYARVAALLALLGVIAYLLYLLVKTLGMHLSCSAAARHVEGGTNLDQQLVTAIEYYENTERYPYSRALAEHVVLRVHRATLRQSFDATVPKWQAFLSSAVILTGLIIAGIFLLSNYRFFSTYLARLTRPLDDVAALPATTLIPITKDLAVEYGAKFALEAEIQGKIPDEGTLEIAPAEAISPGEPQAANAHKVYPAYSEGKQPRFMLEPVMEVGSYRYRFTAGEAATEWHSLSVSTQPKIRKITAAITLPGSRLVKPYTEEVKDFALEVLRGSQVELTIQATEPLTRVGLKRLDGHETAIETTGADTFTTTFTVNSKGTMSFALTSATGITNDRIPPLGVAVKLNEPPEIQLSCPDGDCLAANVASIPISFDVSDDFGLETAQINFEIAGNKLDPVRVAIDKGARSATLLYLLELEDYELNVGDTILYYAEATDIDIGTAEGKRPPGLSDVQMIEIRPYRVPYFPPPPPMGIEPGGVPIELPDTLSQILEYSRAILKKTWAIAAKQTLSNEDRPRLNSIKEDVDYCIKQLETIRDNPRTPFAAIAGISSCIDYFGQAGKELSSLRADLAIDPEKKAYQELRKLVDEMYRLTRPSTGQPKDKRDAVSITDKAHVKVFDSQIVADETERVAQDIAEAQQAEEAIKKSFDHFLADKGSKPGYRQQTNDERSWEVPQPQGQQQPPSSSETGPQSSSQITTEGPRYAQPPSSSQAPATGTGRQASARERLQMLEARQQTLKQDVSSVKERLAAIPEPGAKATTEDRAASEARKAAGSELGKAESSMDEAQKGIERMRREDDAQGKLAEAVSSDLDGAAAHLDKAKDVLFDSLRPEKESDALLATSEELSALADEYERTRSSEAKSRLDRAVENARKQIGPLESTAASQRPSGVQSGRVGYDGYTVSPGFAFPPENQSGMTDNLPIARYLAARFWTLAIKARKNPSPVTEGERSNAELHRLENRFYEDAAHYGTPEKRK